ncbi:MAG: NAD(P)-dependent iron-only hydrogenase iron-sulfur protein [Treponema sp. CETP13]|nr:MAG: NAD(P)-dependent iron-only hydrogenase iron-sulfur protein [Treponema sp. CETP13]
MAKMTLEQLRALRGEKKSEIQKRDTDGKTVQIIVGMGTCGIAAGAKETLAAFIDELDSQGLGDITSVRQTGCMGMCAKEPTVEVIVPDMPAVIYGNVDEKIARQIVAQHVKGKQLLDKLILDRPSIDITKN